MGIPENVLCQMAYSHSFHTCNPIDRSKNVPDGAMMVQEDNMVETEKWSTSESRPFVTGNFRLVCTLCLRFNHSTRNCGYMESTAEFYSSDCINQVYLEFKCTTQKFRPFVNVLNNH